jgi:hypothetical protein
MADEGYEHQITFLRGNKKMPTELFASSSSRCFVVETVVSRHHQGAVSREHLDYNLDEFTFRFNRRTSRSPGKLFYRLIQQARQAEPVYWTDVADGKREHGHNL